MAKLPPAKLTNHAIYLITLLLIAAAFAFFIVVDVTAPVNHGLALFSVRNVYALLDGGLPIVHFMWMLVGATKISGDREQEEHDAKTDRSSGTPAPPYELTGLGINAGLRRRQGIF
ncbi:hypothetical protein K445DRAFT_22990 [Daldinia sp. EC12]|nr:hypothetical protein K445DRAFT_22990 [Daldinia sp. EC12]